MTELPAPILGMATRLSPKVPLEYGDAVSFWVEYPSGLIDLSRSKHVESTTDVTPPLSPSQLDIRINAGRTIRIKKDATALIVIDMQK
jgi:hypothetical protein